MATVDGGAYVETEGTPGTPETLAADDALDYHTLTLTPMSAETARPLVKPTRWGAPDKQPYRTHWDISWEGEVKHLVPPTGDTTPPELHDLIRACGWTYNGTAAASGTHVYTLASDPHAAASATPVTIMKEKRTQAGGLSATADTCVGNLSFEWPEGSELVARARLLGGYNRPITQPAPLVGSYNTGAPVTGLTTVTLGAYSAIARSLTFDGGCEPRLRQSGTGLAWPAFLASPNHPGGELVIEEVPATAYDAFSLWEAGTQATWTFVALLGTTKLTLALAGVRVGKPDFASGEPNTLRIPYTVHTSATLTWETP
jgi:hypothetical protein